MVTEGDWTLGGKYTMQYTDNTLQNHTNETYIILLTNVTSINLINNQDIQNKAETNINSMLDKTPTILHLNYKYHHNLIFSFF